MGWGQENNQLVYIPFIPAFSLRGEGAGTCVDTFAQRAGLKITLPIISGQSEPLIW